MKKCIIILNRAAGGSKKISFEKVEKCLGTGYTYTHFTLPDDGEYSVDGYDALAICGGDGTLGTALGKLYSKPVQVYYFPVGTLNDKAKASRYAHARTDCPSCSDAPSRGKAIVLGKCALKNDGSYMDESIFTYVLAAGSFTPIGYTANIELKKKLGVFAYITKVLKEYRIHRINAKIECGLRTFEGEFTLIMFLKSPRCFGFRFNRAFDAESVSGHLIAIRAPKHNGVLGLIELFFPFFRVFFLGLKKERDGRIIFRRIYNANITMGEACTYCRDGEKQDIPAGEHRVSFVRSLCNFNVIEKF